MLPPQAGNGNIRPGFNPTPNPEQTNVPSFPPEYGEVGFDDDQIRSFIRDSMNKRLNNRSEGSNNGGPKQGGPGPQQHERPPFQREDGPFNR